jgi:hypothetical protein
VRIWATLPNNLVASHPDIPAWAISRWLVVVSPDCDFSRGSGSQRFGGSYRRPRGYARRYRGRGHEHSRAYRDCQEVLRNRTPQMLPPPAPALFSLNFCWRSRMGCLAYALRQRGYDDGGMCTVHRAWCWRLGADCPMFSRFSAAS